MSDFLRMARTGITILRKPLRVDTRPLHFQLEPMVGCNLRCQTCQVPDYPPERRAHMSLERFKHLFDQIRPIKVALSGSGEPFLNPELLDLVRHARAGGASVLTTTNFTLVGKRIDEIVDSGLNLIKISVDATTPPTYERIRGRDYLGLIHSNIEALQAAKRRRNCVTPYVRLQFVLQADNLHEIVDLIDVAKRLGVNSVYYQPLETLLVPGRKDALTKGVEFEVLRARLTAAAARAGEIGVSTNAGVLVRSLPAYYRKYQPGVPAEPPTRVCLLPWFSLYLNVFGDVRPCCSFAEGDVVSLGNVFEQPFSEIWNGERYQDLRRRSIERQLTYTICRNCIPNRLRDFVSLSSVLPGFARSGPAAGD